jgi:Right handed beta helix region/Chlamydia polymorphic membrane protein (Chlamydia_PMP) repeat
MNTILVRHQPRLRWPRSLACIVWGICAIQLAGCDGDPISPPAPVDRSIVWHIPGDFNTIAAALDSASTGQEIVLAPGIYYEHGLEIDQGITLRGDADKDGEVVIDGQGLGRVLQVSAPDDTIRFYDLTVANGLAVAGAGVRIIWGRAEFRRCRFLSNSAEIEGGGILTTSTDVFFSHCAFDSNFSALGGGAKLVGGAVVMDTCSFLFNEVTDGGHALGGGCFVGSMATLTGCTFENNSTDDLGGALAALGAVTAVTDCTFRRNTAGSSGGACYLLQSPEMFRCVFEENSAPSAGAVRVSGAGRFQDCEFTLNRSTSGDGILFLYGANPVIVDRCIFNENEGGFGGAFSARSAAVVTFNDCDFNDNVANGWGGAGYLDDNADLTMNRCGISDNSAINGGGALATAPFGETSVTLDQCAITGNSAIDRAGAIYSWGGDQFTASYTTWTDNTAPEFPGGFFGAGSEVLLVCCDIDLEDFGGTGNVTVDNEDCVQ